MVSKQGPTDDGIQTHGNVAWKIKPWNSVSTFEHQFKFECCGLLNVAFYASIRDQSI